MMSPVDDERRSENGARTPPEAPAPGEPAVSGAAPGPRLLLGLGNPGEQYRDTRHNLGFRVVEEVARRRGIALEDEECGSLLGRSAAGDLTLALPQTFMNRSGWAARCLAELHGFDPGAVLVIYDEARLPLGKLRLRPGGSPGGHRGMESVVENLRTAAVPRLRLGCGPEDGELPGEELVEYVLGPFAPEETEAVEALVARAADACEAWLEHGSQEAMNRFNG